MFRKLLIPVLALLLISASIFFYFSLRQTNPNRGNALRGIPTDAAFILEAPHLQELFKRVDETNILWQDMRVTSCFSSLRSNLHFLDSLFASDPRFEKLNLPNNPGYLSSHPSGNSNNYLFSYALPERNLSEPLEAMLTEKFHTAKGKNDVWCISTADRREVCYYGKAQGVVFFSPSEKLLNEALVQSSKASSLLDDKTFSEISVTAKSSRFDLRLFIHYPPLGQWISPFLSVEFQTSLSRLDPVACWTVLDITVKPKSLLMNGFTSYLSDSTYISLFRDQEPQHPEALSVMPSNTASFLYSGFSDFSRYYSFYKKKQTKAEHTKLDSISKRYDTDISAEFISWTENETVSLLTEPGPGAMDLPGCSFAIFRSSNIKGSEASLSSLCDRVSKTDSVKNDTVRYASHVIRHLKIKGILPLVYGPQYRVQENYFVQTGNYLVFGNSPEALKNYLHFTDNDHTLTNDAHFNEFSANLASVSNVFLYTNIARSRSIYESLSSEETGKDIRRYGDLLIRFEAAAIQFSSQGKLFYNTAYLEENPIYKKETSTLWETRLDTTSHSRPWLMNNPVTHTRDILVQDDGNKLYLITSTGNISWTRQLTENITGTVYQVDAFKNNKLQMLFSTRNQIYLIDRNGKDVEGFPINLSSPACNGITLVDYDHSLDYRILVSCVNKHILNYTIHGKATEGWMNPETPDTAVAPIQHTVFGKKDYLVSADLGGNILVFDRHGERHMELHEKLPRPLLSFSLEKGKDPAHVFLTASDSLGNILRLSLDEKKEHLSFKTFATHPRVMIQDMNGDQIPEYIFLEDNELSVFTYDKSLLFSYVFSDTITQAPFYLNDADGHGRIGVVSDNKEELYLLNGSGLLPEGFPLRGTKPFVIGDLNKDNTLLLISGEGKNIYAYIIP
jgi:hypothetical protein